MIALKLFKIAVLISGGGSNLQALIDAFSNKFIENGEIALVISNNKGAYGLTRASQSGIDHQVINDDETLLKTLDNYSIDGIVLAGYLKILPKDIIKKYENKIINIHPSLIPKFCGKGFYGLHVHKAVILAKEVKTGATVHFVDEGVDTGKIILQEETFVDVNDTPLTLQQKVLAIEHKIIVKALKSLLEKDWVGK